MKATSAPALSSRVQRIESSITLALAAKAAEMRRAGRDVINMAVGEPDFPAPPVAQAAAVTKVQSGDVRYTAAAGTIELREAVARHLTSSRGVPYEAQDVCICHSSKHALMGALLATVSPGDEVLVPLPSWSSYVDMIRIADGTPVRVPPATPGSVRPDLAALSSAVTERTRALLINSPNNPSGAVFDRAETEGLLDLARRHDLVLFSDEIYRALSFDGPAVSPVELADDARERTILLDGASKVYAMTGYRIGFAAGPREVIGAIGALQSQMTGSPNAVSQAAFLAALEGAPPETETMRKAFAERRDAIVAGLRGLGLDVPVPGGAFYAFPDVSPFLRPFEGTGKDASAGFCEALLEAQNLALVPGSAFGCDRHVRLSYALGLEQIEDALGRLGSFLDGLRF